MSTKKPPAKKAAKKAVKKNGRPRKVIDGDMVENLSMIGCTLDEIGHVVGCSRDTLERRFAAKIDKGKNECKTRLRKAQMTKALAGNVPLLIFLGKQMLGQSDRIDQHNEHTGPDGGPLKTEANMVQVVLAGTDSTWDPSQRGGIEEARDGDIGGDD